MVCSNNAKVRGRSRILCGVLCTQTATCNATNLTLVRPGVAHQFTFWLSANTRTPHLQSHSHQHLKAAQAVQHTRAPQLEVHPRTSTGSTITSQHFLEEQCKPPGHQESIAMLSEVLCQQAVLPTAAVIQTQRAHRIAIQTKQVEQCVFMQYTVCGEQPAHANAAKQHSISCKSTLLYRVACNRSIYCCACCENPRNVTAALRPQMAPIVAQPPGK
jgi:hypothetical protein